LRRIVGLESGGAREERIAKTVFGSAILSGLAVLEDYFEKLSLSRRIFQRGWWTQL